MTCLSSLDQRRQSRNCSLPDVRSMLRAFRDLVIDCTGPAHVTRAKFFDRDIDERQVSQNGMSGRNRREIGLQLLPCKGTKQLIAKTMDVILEQPGLGRGNIHDVLVKG